jgi:homospermidine synthase
MMSQAPVYGEIDGPIVMIGFGSIGRGTLPLIERHFSSTVAVRGHRPDDRDADPRPHGIRFIHQAVTRDRYRHLLEPLLTAGGGRGFCVNLSVDTSSLDIMRLCRELGTLYIDTVVEPWPGFYFDRSVRSRGPHQQRAAAHGPRGEGPPARWRAPRPCRAAGRIRAWCPGSSSRRS